MRMRPILMAALAAGLFVAACHKAPEEAPPADNDQIENNVGDTEAPNSSDNAAMANMAETNASIAEEEKPRKPHAWTAPAVSADQQTQDDADATGMTARVSPDGSPDSGGGNNQ